MRPEDNPFNSRRVEALPFRLPGVDPEVLLERLAQQGRRGLLVGLKGSGKTTLLETLERRLRARGDDPLLLRLNESMRRLDGRLLRSAAGRPLLLDGAEQLTAWRRAWVLRVLRACPLAVFTVHRPLRNIPILLRLTPTPDLLHSLTRELLGAAPLPPDLDDLFVLHGGDLRLVFRTLYDRYAAQN